MARVGRLWPGCVRHAEVPLQQLTMLVTTDGQSVLPDSEAFRAALGDPDPDYDAVGFAVRNLGFVKLQVLDRLVTEIELHPRNVELPALLAVEQLVDEVGTNLFRIRYLEDEWHSEISASADHTVARLRELCAPAFEPSQAPRFASEVKDVAPLFAADGREYAPFSQLAQKWRVSFGHFDDNTLSFVANNQLMSNLVIIGVNPHDPDPVFRYVGADHSTWLDPKERFEIIGQRMENMPDKDYGSWVSDLYRNTARNGQPHYDRVTASIRRHEKLYRTSYERFLLPWKTGTDEVLVTVCNRRLGGDAAASPAAAEGDNSRSKKAAKSS